MRKIHWPLNEPIETNTYGKYKAYIRHIHSDGTMVGDAHVRTGYRAFTWTPDGKTANRDEWGFDLIPPKPARQYGYAVWNSCAITAIGCLSGSAPYDTLEEGDVTTFPIPRPGEKLCVVPSREDVRDVMQERLCSTAGLAAAVDAVMALFEDM